LIWEGLICGGHEENVLFLYYLPKINGKHEILIIIFLGEIQMNRQIITQSLLLISLFVLGCVSTPSFDQVEYDRAIILKIDALSLLGNASKNFQLYQNDVLKIQKDMQFMLEYAKNKPNNEECITLWERMIDPDGSFLGNILKEWELRGALDDTYARGLSTIISDRFDDIIELLGKRVK
jgi:hypothetical protein